MATTAPFQKRPVLLVLVLLQLLSVHGWSPESSSSSSSSSSSLLRRKLLKSLSSSAALLTTTTTTTTMTTRPARAAPPVSIIAEELGYFPVSDSKGQVRYVPKRVSRHSSDQAVALAQHLQQQRAVMYGAYWCPHCAHQKELLGREAFALVTYVECAPQGFHASLKACQAKDIDGFPTWIVGKGRKALVISGERPLQELARLTNFPQPFDESLEENLPTPLGLNSCK